MTTPRYPHDLLLCLVLSLLLIPIELLTTSSILHVLIGLPFAIFIPGYLTMFVLFPMRKKKRSIDVLERIGFSFAITIALVPLFAFAFNFSPWGIRLEPLVVALAAYSLILNVAAFIRWHHLPVEDRYLAILRLPTPLPRPTTLGSLLACTIIIIFGIALYTASTPRPGEAYTAFSITDPTGKIADYPFQTTANGNDTVLLHLDNHEQQPMNYTITVWLSQQTTTKNATHQNITVYYHFWYVQTIYPSIGNQTQIPDNATWTIHYPVSLNKSGTFRLEFLLTKTNTTVQYIPWQDYVAQAGNILASPYERLSLILSIH